MELRLEADGIKLVLDPEDLNIITHRWNEVARIFEVQARMIVRVLVAVDALGAEKLQELLERAGDTPEGWSKAVLELCGEDFIRRLTERLGGPER